MRRLSETRWSSRIRGGLRGAGPGRHRLLVGQQGPQQTPAETRVMDTPQTLFWARVVILLFLPVGLLVCHPFNARPVLASLRTQPLWRRARAACTVRRKPCRPGFAPRRPASVGSSETGHRSGRRRGMQRGRHDGQCSSWCCPLFDPEVPALTLAAMTRTLLGFGLVLRLCR